MQHAQPGLDFEMTACMHAWCCSGRLLKQETFVVIYMLASIQAYEFVPLNTMLGTRLMQPR